MTTRNTIESQARERAEYIRENLGRFLALHDDLSAKILAAWQASDWATLGYQSWAEYTSAEFGLDKLRLPPELRQRLARDLRGGGLSYRQIGSALGMSTETTHKAVTGRDRYGSQDRGRLPANGSFTETHDPPEAGLARVEEPAQSMSERLRPDPDEPNPGWQFGPDAHSSRPWAGQNVSAAPRQAEESTDLGRPGFIIIPGWHAVRDAYLHLSAENRQSFRGWLDAQS